jgi:hypothetical protein
VAPVVQLPVQVVTHIIPLLLREHSLLPLLFIVDPMWWLAVALVVAEATVPTQQVLLVEVQVDTCQVLPHCMVAHSIPSQ